MVDTVCGPTRAFCDGLLARNYLPWRLFEWWFAYEAYAPEIFEEGGVIAAGGGIAGALFAIINSVCRARQSQLVTTYGSARWATLKEIKAAGLFAPKGVFLGRFGDSYLRHDGPEHVMCFAPTRSGKGVGLVLPTLLSWTSSAVVHDIKGENWELTSGWRSTFSHCLLFNPTDARSARSSNGRSNWRGSGARRLRRWISERNRNSSICW
jgi:type IV secretion system protein VirD4